VGIFLLEGESEMNDKNYALLKFIYAKYNELNSLKKYTQDEVMLKVIEAKQDTLNDMEKVLKNEITQNILDI
jgi:hypothetical protein